MDKKMINTIIFLISISIFFTGCSTTQNLEGNIAQKQIQAKGGLKITGWCTALGSENDSDLDKTKFFYSIDIANENEKTIFIKSIEPLVNGKVKNRINSKDTVINVNKDVKPNEATQISGEIIVNTKGLTKSDILKLESFVTNIKVTTEEIISFKH